MATPPFGDGVGAMKVTKTISLRGAIDLLHAGRPLMRMHTRTGCAWFIVPDGEVSATVAEALLERPDVQPQNDGLFPGISQTFRVCRSTHPEHLPARSNRRPATVRILHHRRHEPERK